MSELGFLHTCFICKHKFKFGPTTYDGKHIAAYEIIVCKRCFNNNWDGWANQDAVKIISHLKSNSIAVPDLNERNWLPRGD